MYEMTIAETQEAAHIQAQIDTITVRIAKLTPHDSLIDALPWEGTGHNGSTSARRIAKRRVQYLDRTLDAASKIAPLLSELRGLQVRLGHITSGHKAGEASRVARNLKQAHTLQVGDTIATGYGVCTIIRINAKTISIRTPMGRTERILYTQLSS